MLACERITRITSRLVLTLQKTNGLYLLIISRSSSSDQEGALWLSPMEWVVKMLVKWQVQ